MGIAGAASVIRNPLPDDPIVFITEGYRAGCAIYTALNGDATVYAAMSLSKIQKIVAAARWRHRLAYIFVCSDSDKAGMRYGSDALGGDTAASVLIPIFSSADENLRNFADLHIQESPAAVKAQLEDAIKQLSDGVITRRSLHAHDQSSQTTRTG